MRRLVWSTLLVVFGCATPAGQDAAVRSYDFGVEPPPLSSNAIRSVSVKASAPFDSPDMVYRLGYRDSRELLSFTESRWAAPPALLLQRHYARSAQSGGCEAEFELLEISQLFSTPESSEILLAGRAKLARSGRPIGEQSLQVRETGAGSNAASGVRAAGRAAERLFADISAWASGLVGCAGS